MVAMKWMVMSRNVRPGEGDRVLLSRFAAKEIAGSPPPPSWNFAPTQDVPVIAERVEDDSVDRRLLIARWGLGSVLGQGHPVRLEADRRPQRVDRGQALVRQGRRRAPGPVPAVGW
jgi:hypothetical protein